MEEFELVVGLEIHAQLSTKSKAYAADSAGFGDDPNTNISVITLGHPGTLPKANEQVIDFAVKMGLATNCTIRLENQYARKNYFYADLPKGYQITQDTTPICTNGFVDVKLKDGSVSRIGITRIHMEEDAGKSIHDQDYRDTLIDLNRAGVPLIEIVSEPDIRSSEQAGAYLTELRKVLRYLEICDGNMEEGSMRCDANISVRKKGATAFGNRCEVKNLNSIRNVQRAIEYEFQRQVEVIKAGGHIDQNTLNFDAATGKTSVLRSKEMANDYRYFPEPDLPPVVLTNEYIQAIQRDMPALPEQLFKQFTQEYQLTDYDASLLIDQKELAMYFMELGKHCANYKLAANWIMGAIKSYLNEQAISITEFPIQPNQIAAIIHLIETAKISNTSANQILFPALIKDPTTNVEALAQSLNIIISTSNEEMLAFVNEVLAKYPEKVAEYQAGKKGLLGLFMGEVMKLAKGKLDPKEANKLVIEALEK
ncbi:MAG: Asp-tRNA(Asn)/Glu-tRNA(Gln) amidotransferase subunit GatB [Bacteroidota bacterium]|jgi:aspartyl-tRNA(Asn)/glutamyl-tRNA(Gln) amidotransferase subunit B